MYDLTQENKETTIMGKSIFRSKTVWVNLIMAAVSIGTYLMDSAMLANHPEIIAIGGTIIGVANVILRLITKEPIKTLA